MAAENKLSEKGEDLAGGDVESPPPPASSKEGRKKRLSKKERKALKREQQQQQKQQKRRKTSDDADASAAAPAMSEQPRSSKREEATTPAEGGVAERGNNNGDAVEKSAPQEQQKKKRKKKKKSKKSKRKGEGENAEAEPSLDNDDGGETSRNDTSAIRTRTVAEGKSEEEYLLNYVQTPVPTEEEAASVASAHEEKGGGKASKKQQTKELGRWFPGAVIIKTKTAPNAAPESAHGRKKRKRKDSSGSAAEVDRDGIKSEPNEGGARRREAKASLVLFYQYVSPRFSPERVAALTEYLKRIAVARNLGGRIRVAAEGLNATVSSIDAPETSGDGGGDETVGKGGRRSAAESLRHFAEDLRRFDSRLKPFASTDFKYIDGLPPDRHFKELKILPVKELVFYGIDKKDAPLDKGGVHLDAPEYHKMLGREDAVVIDVRNHYEAAIGRFDGQQRHKTKEEKKKGKKKKGEGDATLAEEKSKEGQASEGGKEEREGGDEGGTDADAASAPTGAEETAAGAAGGGGAEYLDPLMRKSTDFPSWLSRPDTKSKLAGKTVLMYCTGGVRCERASAYLNTQMGGEVKGVYQLKGGIERYLKAFPDGGYWRGKNFVFDKREAVGAESTAGDGGVIQKKKGDKMSAQKTAKKKKKERDSGDDAEGVSDDMARCCVCSSPWDRYVGKKRCYTCGVPVLMCDACMSSRPDRRGSGRELDVRCPLCKEEGVTVPADEVEYTANGVRGLVASSSGGDDGGKKEKKGEWKMEGTVDNEDDSQAGEGGKDKKRKKRHGVGEEDPPKKGQPPKAAPSVLKWGGGHARRKKELRMMGRTPCRFGSECARKDCFFAHPGRRDRAKKKKG